MSTPSGLSARGRRATGAASPRWWLALLVALSMVAVVAPAAPTAAQTPVKGWVPDDIRRTAPPVGDGGGDPAQRRAPVRVDELVERRTATSATWRLSDGSLETVVSAVPVHYRDEAGAWQAIDTTLVDDPHEAYAARTKASDAVVRLPAELSAAPVQLRAGSDTVAFALQGAAGRPAVEGNAAVYADALPGVDVSYAATATGVKEELVLHHSEATRFVFTVAGKGLAPTAAGDRAVALVDRDGNTRFVFAAPFMVDAAGVVSHAVGLTVDDDGRQVVLEADAGWLADPQRAWPVTIDPTLDKAAAQSCFIDSATPDTHRCTEGRTALEVGNDGAGVNRTLLDFDVTETIRQPASVEIAELALRRTDGTAAAAPVQVHNLAEGWDQRYVTWNQRTNATAWQTPGATHETDPVDVAPDTRDMWGTDHSDGSNFWNLTALVQGRLDGQRPASGIVLKATDETAGGHYRFDGVDTTSAPQLHVRWFEARGLRDWYSHTTFDLTQDRTARVNVANGNLTVSEQDGAVAGVAGHDVVLARTYNGRDFDGGLGRKWVGLYDARRHIWLIDDDPSTVVYYHPTGYVVTYQKRADGSYRPLTRDDSHLVDNGDGSWTVVEHDTGVRYTFHRSGALETVADRNANTITLQYEVPIDQYVYGQTKLSAVTDTRGRVFTYYYDTGGFRIVDPGGREHRYTTDADGYLTSYTDPEGLTTSYSISGGQLVTLTDAEGNITTFAYDWSHPRLDVPVSSITRVTDPATGAGHTTTFAYNDGNTVVTDPNGHATTYHHDRSGRVTKVVDAAGNTRTSTYTDGDLTNTASPSGATTTLTWDDRRLTSSQAPTGAISRLYYDDPANRHQPTRVADPQGNTTSYTYTANGNVASITDASADANRWTHEYNPNGTVARSVDPAGNATVYGYDTDGQLTSIDPPDPLGTITITYDGVSRIATVVDGRGTKRWYAYDANDRVTGVSFDNDGGLGFGYDAVDNLVWRDDATSRTTFAYDALNRLVQEAFPNGETNGYSWDGEGNLTAFTDASGTTAYGYDQIDQATSVTDPNNRTTTFGYDTDGNRTSTAYPNGVTQTATFDASARIERITGTDPTGTALTDFTYNYTDAGNDTALRQSVTDTNANTTRYGYDALNRLIEATTTDPAGTVTKRWVYGYDARSNRTTKTVDGATTTYTYNAANQLTGDSTGTSYSYDGAGNLTGTSAGLTLAYNGKNQTTAATTPDGTRTDIVYRGLGQNDRASVNGAQHIHSRVLGLTAVDPAGTATFYTHDPQGTLVSQRVPQGDNYYLFDGQGSVAAVTDGTGALRNTYTYSPYGDTVTAGGPNPVTNPYRYIGSKGYYHDDTTGLYHVGQRYYQPDLGRWTQQDPIINRLDPAQTNRYAYAGCNPTTYTDPTGAITEACILALLGAGVAIPVFLANPASVFAILGYGLAVYSVARNC